MPFRKWDPLQDLIMLHQDLFGEASESGLTEPGITAWSPALDLYETVEAFTIKVEVPGIAPDSIRLEFRDNKVVISGERPSPRSGEGVSYHHIERFSGRFERIIALPPYVCCQDISAQYRDGVLEITIPKNSSPGPKTIKVAG